MRNKKKWLGAGVTLLLLAAGTGLWAWAASEQSVTNHLSTSVVDIELENYEMVDGKEIPFSKEKKEIQVMPGMRISQIPKITNEAVDCYVRARITMEGKREVERPLSVKDISGFSDAWVPRGDYYYYTEILETEDTVRLFDTITIPAEWDTKYDAKGVVDYYTRNDWELYIRVDAIQAAHFSPDFAGQSPWGVEGTDYEIQECIHEDEYEVNAYQQINPPEFTVVYEGDAKELVISQDDFFTGIETLLPGDIKEGVFTMENKKQGKQNFLFRTKVLEEKEILEQITLKIETAERLLYEGPLNSRELDSYIGLCSLEQGETKDVRFTLTVPKELDNSFTLNHCKVRWQFAVEDEPGLAEAAKTGDAMYKKMFLIVMRGLGAACVILGIFIRRSYRKRGGK